MPQLLLAPGERKEKTAIYLTLNFTPWCPNVTFTALSGMFLPPVSELVSDLQKTKNKSKRKDCQFSMFQNIQIWENMTHTYIHMT